MYNYATLDQFKRFAETRKVRWSLIAGSLVGVQCFNAMNPWDDDIDVQIPRQDDHKLMKWWSTGEWTLDYNHDEYWHQQYVLNRTHLLYKFTAGNRYKLISVAWRKFAIQQKFVDLGGIDLFSMPQNGEIEPQKYSNFESSITASVATVKFGPILAHIPNNVTTKLYSQKKDGYQKDGQLCCKHNCTAT